MKHSTLIGNYEEGSFKDVDFPSKFKSLKIIWIRKISDENNFHPWIAVAQEILRDPGRQKYLYQSFYGRNQEKICTKITIILQS